MATSTTSTSTSCRALTLMATSSPVTMIDSGGRPDQGAVRGPAAWALMGTEILTLSLEVSFS